jgi:hypothetical protein
MRRQARQHKQLEHPCDRALIYSRSNWRNSGDDKVVDDAPLHAQLCAAWNLLGGVWTEAEQTSHACSKTCTYLLFSDLDAMLHSFDRRHLKPHACMFCSADLDTASRKPFMHVHIFDQMCAFLVLVLQVVSLFWKRTMFRSSIGTHGVR